MRDCIGMFVACAEKDGYVPGYYSKFPFQMLKELSATLPSIEVGDE